MATLTRGIVLAGLPALGPALAGCAGGPIAAVSPLSRREEEISPAGLDWAHLKWRRGIESQRRADNGDGTFLNPILSGDHPDPTILRDGDRWLMTFSSFESYPARAWRSAAGSPYLRAGGWSWQGITSNCHQL